MRILFATAELTPIARVGGLAEAAAGLVAALRAADISVEVVLPDYGSVELEEERHQDVTVPTWAQPATARRGIAADFGDITLVSVPGMAKPHPYIDDAGQGWPDNDRRFFAFSAAIASLIRTSEPDVVHLNDWHTGATLAFLNERPPTALTIHTLGYQGWAGPEWIPRIPHNFSAFESYGGVNPLAGAIQTADRVIAVSPNYADEIRRPDSGMGLASQLSDLGNRLVGIRNGIDASIWNPETDGYLDANYTIGDVTGKAASRAELLATAHWEDDVIPIVGIVTRLVDQKGIDLALEAVRFAERVPFRLVMLGSGERGLAEWAAWAAETWPNNVFFAPGYNLALAHTIFAGSDLLLMPSRFEPCGLAQMQAMAYGTIPVVTDVGGLHDTVIDADVDRYSRRDRCPAPRGAGMEASPAETSNPEARNGTGLVVDGTGPTAHRPLPGDAGSRLIAAFASLASMTDETREKPQTPDEPNLLLDGLEEKLAAFQAFRKTDDTAADELLSDLGAQDDVDRDIVLELSSKRPLGHPERFPQAHSMAVRSLEVLDRNGPRSVKISGFGFLNPIIAFLVQQVAHFIVRSHQASVADEMLRLYARREANCLPDDPNRRLLMRARLQMERVTPGFKRNALGVPAFLLGGAVFSTLISLVQRAVTAALSDWWTKVLATMILGLLIVALAWVILRGAAVARRRIQLTLDRPIQALWQTIGRCGEPPKDPSKVVALIAIILALLPWLLIPGGLLASWLTNSAGI